MVITWLQQAFVSLERPTFEMNSVDQNEDYNRLPEPFRKLLNAELAARNSVTEISHSFPAPAGACFRLAKRLITRISHANENRDGETACQMAAL